MRCYVEQKLNEFNDKKTKTISSYLGLDIGMAKSGYKNSHTAKIVIETLTRIGICNKKEKRLTPSCYIMKVGNKYKLYHFKELLIKDGFKNTLTENDYDRRDSIATMLENWGLIRIKNRAHYRKRPVPIFVLKSKYKNDYKICHKYDF